MADNKDKDAEKAPETTAQRDERVRLAEEDRAARFKTSPITGATSFHDVVRHLLTHGPARNDAERDELAGIVNDDDPAYKDPGADPADDRDDRDYVPPADRDDRDDRGEVFPASPLSAPATKKGR